MPRLRLKGLHRVKVKLADGRRVVYCYAWRGGPRVEGEPGTPAFFAAYNEAVASVTRPTKGTLQDLIDAYQTYDEFTKLAPRTKADYVKKIRLIERKFGTFPLVALPAPKTRGVFKDWRDDLARKSKRQADYAWVVLARIFSRAKDRGNISVNPCEKGGRLYDGSRAELIWTDDDEAAFLASAPAHLRLPLLLALWTGQRQGDLLRLPWSAYDGTHIRLRQGKTGERVTIPVGAPLKAALDAAIRQGPIILNSTDKRPWTADGFSSSWRKATKKAGIARTFHDLRGTAVTRLAGVGCSVAEIATITGHSLADVHEILDAHYLARDPTLAESAIRKLESRTPAVK